MEPLLGAVDLGLCDCDQGSVAGPGGAGGVTCPKCSGTGGRMLDWVIVGSESGSGARRDPNMVSWVASLRDQCVNAGVAFLWKQDVIDGKKIGAPQLEGQSWQQFPA